MTRGWLRRNRYWKIPRGLPDGLAGRGFCVSSSIPKVMLRRKRPLDPESEAAGRFLPGIHIAFVFVLGFVIDFSGTAGSGSPAARSALEYMSVVAADRA